MAYGFNLGQIEGLDSSVKTVTLTIANATESNTYTLTYFDAFGIWIDSSLPQTSTVVLAPLEPGGDDLALTILAYDASDVGDTYNVTISTSAVEENFKSAVETVLADNGLIDEPETLFDGTITITAEDIDGVEIPFDKDISSYPFEKWTVTINGLEIPYQANERAFLLEDGNISYAVYNDAGVYPLVIANTQDERFPPVPGDYQVKIVSVSESGGLDDNLIIFTYDDATGNYSCNKTLADIVTDGALNGICRAAVMSSYDITWVSSITYYERNAQLVCDAILPDAASIFRYILKSDGSVEQVTGTTNLTVEWNT